MTATNPIFVSASLPGRQTGGAQLVKWMVDPAKAERVVVDGTRPRHASASNAGETMAPCSAQAGRGGELATMLTMVKKLDQHGALLERRGKHGDLHSRICPDPSICLGEAAERKGTTRRMWPLQRGGARKGPSLAARPAPASPARNG